MNFNEYQKTASDFAIYPNKGSNLIYPVLGLCGESGEVSEKLKKIIRDKNGELSKEDVSALIKELGDVLWYVSAIAGELRVSLEEVAFLNIMKLQSRKDRDTLSGSGDNR